MKITTRDWSKEFMSMDQPLRRSRWNPKMIWAIGTIAIAAILLWLVLGAMMRSGEVSITGERVSIAEVRTGTFEDFILAGGVAEPNRSIFLDAHCAGFVTRVLHQPGDTVLPGDTILLMENATFLLDIMYREAELFQQRNNLRNSRLALEQNQLDLDRNLEDIKFRLATAHRDYARDSLLFNSELISADEYLQSRDELDHLGRLLRLTQRARYQDSVFRQTQVSTLEETVERIEQNLTFVRSRLDNLVVCSPYRGQLTSLEVEEGQALQLGSSIGRIDVLDGFKIRAEVDEHYLSQVAVGLKADFTAGERVYDLVVTQVRPEVRNNRFEIHLEFVGAAPYDMTRGQSIHLRLHLSEQFEAILVDNGGFIRSTGGRWAFVLTDDGSHAVRRTIRIGKRNPQTVEVLDGLMPGDRVVVSSYDAFIEANEISIGAS